jgi:diguanylate cyclase (GGDEF)-like protein
MRVLVLEQGTKERATIQQALQGGKYEAVFVESAEQGRKLISDEGVRFVVADAELSDVLAFELVHKVRSASLPAVYFLVLTSREELKLEADDILHKPFKPAELQTRLAIGQRILAMGDNLSQARQQLESTAMYDPLTETMNQAAFNRQAKSELERARRSAATLSIISLNIDNFESLNNHHGNEMGNEILKMVAKNIRERSRPYDCVGRWTGPEFLIALLNVSGEDAEKIARRIITGIRFTEIKRAGTVLELSISAGVAAAATSTEEKTDIEPLVEQARQARERARQMGGYQVLLTNI